VTRPHAGRPPHVPTDESRTLVESLSGFGIPQPNSRAWSASIRRCYGIRSTTDEMRSLDVRRWEREGMRQAGHHGGWQWLRRGEVPSIRMQAEADRVIQMIYRHAAERALRGLALGRKAWLFAGSDRGGERAALLYGLIVTAKLNDVDPQTWLADVLARIAEHPASRLDELLPWHWTFLPTAKAA